ncbi:hypothetical protein CKO42_22085 [Lamprobacter modestohalophilus]|uniref:DUF2281 domain-containing protein n=1 Tax=Lamprobacter modestohalophilus TaxID=1064514 RepID=A0A9X1B6N7_9GAMM|nr:hypothetical protein [Lamprobacter modestohalophilus]MBK1621061.1 hypothetical protein [Lamprobacter modestohalophilus]
MTLAETIYQKSLTLPPEKAREVLDFIDFIKDRPGVTAADSDRGAAKRRSLLEVFEEAGLVGCLETDEQLSTTYKAQLDFSHKHGGPV